MTDDDVKTAIYRRNRELDDLSRPASQPEPITSPLVIGRPVVDPDATRIEGLPTLAAWRALQQRCVQLEVVVLEQRRRLAAIREALDSE
jgi:hypothetical protein